MRIVFTYIPCNTKQRLFWKCLCVNVGTVHPLIKLIPVHILMWRKKKIPNFCCTTNPTRPLLMIYTESKPMCCWSKVYNNLSLPSNNPLFFANQFYLKSIFTWYWTVPINRTFYKNYKWKWSFIQRKSEAITPNLLMWVLHCRILLICILKGDKMYVWYIY